MNFINVSRYLAKKLIGDTKNMTYKILITYKIYTE